jgi:hypothetical protein
MVGFMRAIHDNKLLAMEFWRIVSAMTDEDCAEMSPTECVNQVILEVTAKGVTGQSVAGVMAAGRGPRGAMSELASLLAGEDIGSPVVNEPPRVEVVEVKDDIRRKDFGKESVDTSELKAARTAKPVKSAKDPAEGVYFKYSKLIQYATDHPEESFWEKDIKDTREPGDSKPRIDARIDARDAPRDRRDESNGNGSRYAEFLKDGADATEPEVKPDPRRKATIGYPAVPPSLWQYQDTYQDKVREESRQALANPTNPIPILPPPVNATYHAAPPVAAAPPAQVAAFPNVEAVEKDPMEALIPLSLVVASYRRRMRIGLWIIVIVAIGCGMVSGAMLACGYGAEYWWKFESWMRRQRHNPHAITQNVSPRVDGSLFAGIRDSGRLQIRLNDPTRS